MNPYDTIDNIFELYELLQDDLSRRIFWARLEFDIEPSMSRVIRLLQFSEGYTEEEILTLKTWKETARKQRDTQNKIFLYGSGNGGCQMADLIRRDGEDFFAFCDRRASEPGGIHDLAGKPVYPPSYLFEHMEQCYVMISTTVYYGEVEQFLLQNGFPQDHIFPFHFDRYTEYNNVTQGKQYFAFPEFYKKGTTFIDAGGYDGETSIQFAAWCDRQYENILVFEPDPKSYEICKKRLEKAGLQRFHIIEAGLAAQNETVTFVSGLNVSSYIPDADSAENNSLVESGRSGGQVESIQVVKLDEYTEDLTVGFIKMDIEGAEMGALQGAQDTIRRDKPLMALSAYHRRGDVLAIMGYLHQLVPEYRFWVRHYGPLAVETVLYAAV